MKTLDGRRTKPVSNASPAKLISIVKSECLGLGMPQRTKKVLARISAAPLQIPRRGKAAAQDRVCVS